MMVMEAEVEREELGEEDGQGYGWEKPRSRSSRVRWARESGET